MIYLTVLTAAITIYELISLRGKGQKKEIVVLISLAVITFLFGLFYISNPNRNSLAGVLFNISGSNGGV